MHHGSTANDHKYIFVARSSGHAKAYWTAHGSYHICNHLRIRRGVSKNQGIASVICKHGLMHKRILRPFCAICRSQCLPDGSVAQVSTRNFYGKGGQI